MTTLLTAFVLGGFGLLLAGFVWLQRRGVSLSYRVLAALLAGGAYGLALNVAFGPQHAVTLCSLEWVRLVGSGYVHLLQMVVMPLVLVMMIAAVLRAGAPATLGRYGGLILLVLVGTTAVAAGVGLVTAQVFGLSADGLTEGARELERAAVLTQRQAGLEALSTADLVLSFLPVNIFADLAGSRPTSIVAVVVFGLLAGIAALVVGREQADDGAAIRRGVDLVQAWVLALVRLVIALTPYGVLALAARVVAGSDGGDILALLLFVVASYVAIAVMFGVHLGLLMLAGERPGRYLAAVWPVLTFAFASRSSAATIPLNVSAQIEQLSVRPAVANLSAALGATIGQNGCAGIYPAMLAAMIAPSMGINPLDPVFAATLIGVVAISSFGVAGVGGGATFAALIVLPALGFPVVLAALLISIEPLIDMARTALNVNGAMTAGVLTDRLSGEPEPASAHELA